MKAAALLLVLATGAAGDSSTTKQLVVSKLLKEKANVSLGKLTAVENRTGADVHFPWVGGPTKKDLQFILDHYGV